MPYTFNYSNAFTPGIGEALFEGARSQVDFSRVMQNNQVRLQEREAQRQEAQLRLQSSRLSLQRLKEARMQRSARRDAELRREKLKLTKKQSAREAELARMREERLQEQLDWQIEQSSVQNKQQLREEVNQLRAQGAVPADSGMEPPPNSYTYQDTMGQRWKVPRIDPARQRERRNIVRQETNKLRKWGARPVDDPRTIGENAFAYEDAQGRTWAVPRQVKDGLDTDMRDTTIDVLEGRRNSLQKRLENASDSLMSYQERKRNLNKDIQKKEGLLKRYDKDHPRYDTLKADLETLKTERRQIESNIRQMPQPKNLRKQIIDINNRLEGIATGNVSVLGGNEPDEDQRRGSSPAGDQSARSSADLSQSTSVQTRSGDDTEQQESPMEMYARDKQLHIHPQAPDQVKKMSPGEILQRIAEQNPQASMDQVAGLAMKKGYLSPGGLVIMNQGR